MTYALPTSLRPTVATFSAAINAAVSARADRLAPRDSNAAPVIGKGGRLHAPHDGYVWNDVVYAAGEFLADDCAALDTYRILVAIDVKDAMKSLEDVTVTFGAEFDGMCYAYINAPKYITSKLPKFFEKYMVPANCDAPTGKSWKFSYKKYLNSPKEIDVPSNVCLQSLDKEMVAYYRPIVRE